MRSRLSIALIILAFITSASSVPADDLPPPREGRFVDNGDGTVTDTLRRIMWTKDDSRKVMTWREAWDYCESLELAGHSDWRMPTGNDLSNKLFDGLQPPGKWIGDRRVPPFTWSEKAAYWTSSDGDAGHGQPGMFIRDFAEGFAGASRLDDRNLVRPCRPLPRPDGLRFVDNGDGTVTDRWEGLVWAVSDGGKPMTWDEANRYCNNLDLGGKKGWHVPTYEDLHDELYIGLEQYKAGLGLDRRIPPFQWSGQYYWTNQIVVKGEGGAGQTCVRFLDGGSQWAHRESPRHVRPCWP